MFESRVEPMLIQKPTPQLTASWDAATARRDKVSIYGLRFDKLCHWFLFVSSVCLQQGGRDYHKLPVKPFCSY